MRLACILLSTLLLLCLYAHAYNDVPGDIAEPSIKAPNMDMPSPVVSNPNMDMPTKPTSVVKPNDINQNKGLNPISNKTENNASNASVDQTQVAQLQQKARTTDLGGKWLVMFDDKTDRLLDLTLWSSAGASRIMGFGTLTEEATKNSVTASGSMTAQELKLTTKLATSKNANLKYDECDLDLHNVNNIYSGTYILRSAGQFVQKGNATAEMSSAS